MLCSGRALQKQIGYLQRELRGIHIGAIAQNDNREIVLNEALDRGAEPHRLPVVPRALVTAIRVIEGRCDRRDQRAAKDSAYAETISPSQLTLRSQSIWS